MNLKKEKMVSVIIPTYNRESWIKDAVESVFSQSYLNYELIVIDDGSYDDTSKIIRSFGTKIRYFFQSNSGSSVARNKGLELSHGEWITFLDSDDLWKTEKLKKQMKILQKEPQFKICYTDEVWIRNEKFVNPGKKHLKFSGWIYPQCLPLCIISPSSVVIHRSVLQEIGSFDPSLPVAEDYDLWLRISSRYPIKLLPQKLIIKRGGHPDQLSKKYWGMDRFRIKALEKMVNQTHLSLNWRIATLQEITKKATIIANGAKKRKNWENYNFYHTKVKKAKEKILLLSSHYNSASEYVKK